MSASGKRQVHMLSFDVEDWYQGFVYRNISGWEQYPSREGAIVDRILSILDEYKTKATFFVVGRYAEAHPDVVKRIAQHGHEIASHGYVHKPVPQLGRADFRKDVRRSLDVLESIIGTKVRGYRAASWSVTKDCLWALEDLAEEGVEYDSSIFPTGVHAYGFPGAQTYPSRMELPSGRSIHEFPAQVLSLGPLKLPSAGGFYLRALPLFVSRWALHQSEVQKRSGMVYLHPYDLDPGVPRLKTGAIFRIIRYYNLGKTEGHLRRLLKDFRFASIAEIMKSQTTIVTP